MDSKGDKWKKKEKQRTRVRRWDEFRGLADLS